MRSRWTAKILALAAISAPIPAQACAIHVPPTLEDVQYADVVVMGRIANYEIVLDRDARRNRQRMLANSPRMRPELRRSLETQTRFLGDYARFEVIVDRVLHGRAGRTLTVTWNNSTFGEPESMPPGQYLIALRDPHASAPPLRGPSATIVPNREPSSLTVLQAPCSSAFIFERRSEQASAILTILERRPRRPNAR